MGNTFGKKKTLKEQLRENKRTLNRAIRELDRERSNLQMAEKKLIIEIKKMAKEGQTASVKIMAKDLVQTRAYVSKFYTMRSQLQAVSLRLETAKSSEAMTSAMAGTTKVMQGMAKSIDLPKLNQMMQEFVKENEKMELTQELVGDSIDDVMEGDQDEEEQDKIVNQILDEIGIDLHGKVPEAPMSDMASTVAVGAPQKMAAAVAPPVGAAAAAGGGGGAASGSSKNGGLPPPPPMNMGGGGDASSSDATVNELEARLNNLRRS